MDRFLLFRQLNQDHEYERHIYVQSRIALQRRVREIQVYY